MPPCPHALLLARVPARAWRARAELLERADVGRRAVEDESAVRAAAHAAALSQRHFLRVFVAVHGQGPAAYRRARRLLAARAALERGATVAEAREAAGYSSPATFAREFRREFGCSPSSVLQGKGRRRT
jgi:AraC-like DNA-binding protein